MTAHINVSLTEDDITEALSVITHLETELAKARTSNTHAPIAIIGMACRFPGGANSPEAYWDVLNRNADTSGPIPQDRWPTSVFPADVLKNARGHFLDYRPDGFDAALFAIAPAELEALDPQQRLLLETAWEAFEDAGLALDEVAGSLTSVYVGMEKTDYSRANLFSDDLDDITPYTATGISHSTAAGRLSYQFDLQGPAGVVDAACASSLMALDHACSSLRRGQADMALAGGVSLMLGPEVFTALSRLNALSPEGICRSFDAGANGYGRGEGCGIVVLKRLDDAVRDGDNVLAVVEGIAIRHGGRSNGLTAPNIRSQVDVIRAALADAARSPSDISYVEAHGTGTPLGDPIEIAALTDVFGKDTKRGPLWVGSAKSVVGHLEAAAGMAGVLKTVLAFKHGAMSQNCNFETPSPHIDWDNSPVQIVKDSRSWEAGDAARRAGISAFGFSGTVAHAVLAEPPTPASRQTSGFEPPFQLLLLSAHSSEALEVLRQEFANTLEQTTSQDWPRFCANSALTRRHHRHRLTVQSDTPTAMATALRSAELVPGTTISKGFGAVRRPPKVGFVFSGQGGLQSGVGRDLYGTQPDFTAMIDRCAARFDPEVGISLVDALFNPETDQARFDDLRLAQPAGFSLQVALVAMWRAWGVEPALMYGNSFGHFAAAFAAGVLSFEDACDLVVARGKLALLHGQKGEMASCFASVEQITTLATNHDLDVHIAGVNTTENVTLSAREGTLERFAEIAGKVGITVKMLPIERAFHSVEMSQAIAPFAAAVANCTLSTFKVPLISDQTGRIFSDVDIIDPQSWAQQFVTPVLCEASLGTMLENGVDMVIEIGPSSTLSGFGQALTASDSRVQWLPSLRRASTGWQQSLTNVGALHVNGENVNWCSVYAGRDTRRLKLPSYPFQRERYWRKLNMPSAMTSAPDPWEALQDEVATFAPSALSVTTELQSAGQVGRRRLLAKLVEIGLFELLATPKTLVQIASSLGVVTSYERLLGWYLELLKDDGWLRVSQVGHYDTTPQAYGFDLWAYQTLTHEIHIATQAAIPGMGVALTLLENCFAALPSILQGHRNPMSVLMPEGSSELLDGIYKANRLSDAFNEVTATALMHTLGDLHGASVLEIGGGTGGITQAILPRFSTSAKTIQYTFTDISKNFVRNAQHRWSTNFPFVEYATFDVTADPEAQGFATGSLDLVVASNVLHATPDIVSTLTNTARLLRVGGRIVINEATRLHDVVGMIFGLTPDWWTYDDAARLNNCPLLDVDGWRTALTKAGFALETILTLPDDTSRDPLQAVLIARLEHEPARPDTTIYRSETIPDMTQFAPAAAPDFAKELNKLVLDVSGICVEPDDLETDLFSLGLDSLLLMQIRNGLSKRFGVDVKLTEFHGALSTLGALAKYIAQHAPTSIAPQMPPLISQADPAIKAPTIAPQVTLSTTQAQPRSTPNNSSGLEQVVQQQLALMQEQIRLLSGTNTAPLTPPPQSQSAVERAPAVTPKTLSQATVKSTRTNAYSPVRDQDFTPRQLEFLETLKHAYNARTAESKAHAEIARPQLADWIASIGFKPSLKELIYPIVSASSKGSQITDIDGNEYVDLACGFGVSLFGHQPDFITTAIQRQLDEGMELATQNDLAAETAALLCELTGCERVAFSNTGTEAVMTAFRLARAVTGKTKIAIFKGGFHGSYDGAMAFGNAQDSLPLSPGIVQNQIEDVIILDYGDETALEQIRAQAHDLAGVLVEPVQSRNPDLQPRAFLHELRKITQTQNTALIFDEMITGFRCHQGGAQAHFGVDADIVTYGKILGGGMPVSAIAGQARFIDPLDGGGWKYGDESRPNATQIFFGGTFCRHPLAMAAANASLLHLKSEGPILQERLNVRTSAMVGRLNDMFACHNVPLRAANFSSQFQIRQLTPSGEVFQTMELTLLFMSLMLHGVYTWERRTCFLSTAHSDADVAVIEAAFEKSVSSMIEGGFFHGSGRGPQGGSKPKSVRLGRIQSDMLMLSATTGWADKPMIAALEIDGDIDVDRLQSALNRVVKRHEGLCCHHISDDTRFQLDSTAPQINVSLSPYHIWVKEIESRRIDPRSGPLIACDLCKISNGKNILVLSAHKLAADGWSLGLALHEISIFYAKQETILPASVSISHYLNWVETMAAQGAKAAGAYWTQITNDPIDRVVLPQDRFARTGSHQQARRLRRELTPELAQTLHKQSHSVFALLAGSWAKLVAGLSGARRIAIAVPASGQAAMSENCLFGQCAKTLPLVLAIDPEQSSRALLDQIRNAMLELLEHQSVRPQDVLEDASLAPIPNVGLNLDPDAKIIEFGGNSAQIHELGGVDLQFDLNLNVTVVGSRILLNLEYDARYLDSATVNHWATLIETTLAEFCADIDRPLLNLHPGAQVRDDGSYLSALTQALNLEKGALVHIHGSSATMQLNAALAGEVTLQNHRCHARVLLRQSDLRNWLQTALLQEPVSLIIECEHAPVASFCDRLLGELPVGSDVRLILRPPNMSLPIGVATQGQNTPDSPVYFTPLQDTASHSSNRADGMLAPMPFGFAGALLALSPYVAKIEGKLPSLVLTPIHDAPADWIDQARACLAGRLERKQIPHLYAAGIAEIREPNIEVDASNVAGAIAAIIARLLDLPIVGTEDNFFALGGASLTAMRLVAEIANTYGTSLNPVDVFANPTPIGIAARLGKTGSHIAPPIPASGLRRVPATAAQQRMWTLSQIEGQEKFYVMSGAYICDGLLDISALNSALRVIKNRHEILRTGYSLTGGAVWQNVHPTPTDALTETDLAHSALADHIAALAAPRFDLENGNVLRISLARIEGPEPHHALCYAVHHIAMDGWSEATFSDDLSHAYGAARTGNALNWSRSVVQHVDVALWQDARLRSPEADIALERIAKQLKGMPTRLDLPTDFPRNSEALPRTAQSVFRFTDAQSETLVCAARLAETTLYLAAVAVLKALVWRLTGENDVVFGTALTSRPHPDLQDQIGNFVNTVVLRDQIGVGDTLGDLVARVGSNAARAFADGDIPFDRVVDRLGLERDPSRSALFDVLLSAADIPRSTLKLDGHKMVPFTTDFQGNTTFDLSFEIDTSADQIVLRTTYSANLFTERRIECLHSHLSALITGAQQRPETPLGAITLADEDDCRSDVLVLDRRLAPCPRGGLGLGYKPCAPGDADAVLCSLSKTGWITPLYQRFEVALDGEPCLRDVAALNVNPFMPATFTSDSTDLATDMLAIWRKYTPGGTTIFIDDSFFAKGGNSLAAVQLIAELRELTGAKLLVRDIFRHPSVRTMLAHVAGKTQPLAERNTVEEACLKASLNEAALSPSQESMWLLDHVITDHAAYTLSGAFWSEQTVDDERLRAALTAVSAKHAALRTEFMTNDDGTAYQCIHDQIQIPLDVFKITDNLEALEAARVFARKGIDLKSAPHWRAQLIQSGTRSLFSVNIHHAIADGWSVGIFLRDLSIAYAGDALAPQHGDFAAQSLARITARADEQQAALHHAFWAQQLDGAATEIALPLDRARPKTKSFSGGTVIARLDHQETNKLRDFAEDQGLSLHPVLTALGQTLLHRYTGATDFLVGSPSAGREDIAEFDQIGCFMQTFAIRAQFEPDTSFKSLVTQIAARLDVAREHLDYPVERILRARGTNDQSRRLGLFNVIIALEEFEAEALVFDGEITRAAPIEDGTSRADLIFYMRPLASGFELELEYDADLFDPSTAQRIADNFMELVRAALAEPDAHLITLNILTNAERLAVTEQFNDRNVEYPTDKTIAQLFGTIARSEPDRIALSGRGEKFTYGKLKTVSDRIATALIKDHGVQPGDRVALFASREPTLIAAMLGILKAGAAYVPVEPSYPTDRIATLLHLAEPRVIIVNQHSDEIAQHGATAILADLTQKRPKAPFPKGTAADAAYVMFTSGSTGTPKAVVIPQKAIARLVLNTDAYQILPTDILPLAGALSFDAVTLEIWGALLNRATLVIVPQEELIDPWAMEALIKEEKITYLFATTGLFNQFVDLNPSLFAPLRIVGTGGERMSTSHVRKLMQTYPDLNVVNCYGPTENTTFSTSYRMPHLPDPETQIPLGRPVANSSVFVLDNALQPVPIGVSGELYLGGDGLALEYFNRPDLTQERFINHPTFGRLYRSGDLGHWYVDGTLAFLGRSDDQLKIRGQRIEPSEIARVIETLDGVQQAVILPKKAQAGIELIAYIVAEEAYDTFAMRAKLKSLLPKTMLPTHYVLLDAFPLDGNGKVDRKKLPVPDTPVVAKSMVAMDEQSTRPAAAPTRGPANRVETEIAQMWSDLLARPVIDVNADFHELGGHSLLAVRLMTVLERRYGNIIRLADLFGAPTVAGLSARVIDALTSGSVPATDKSTSVPNVIPTLPLADDYAASAQQEQLCYLDQLHGRGSQYVILGGYWIDGALDVDALQSAINMLLHRHEALRTRFTTKAGEVRQVVGASTELPLVLRHLEGKDESEANGLIAALLERPFDLKTGPLVRIELAHFSAKRRLLLISLHHAICDGWSIGILLDELSALYNAAHEGHNVNLSPTPCQPKEHADWQRAHLNGAEGADDRAYWMQALDGEPATLDLGRGPDDALDMAATVAGRRTANVSQESTVKLRHLAQTAGTTLFGAINAVLSATLARLGGTNDIWIGTPVSGRTQSSFVGLVADLANSVVLRSYVPHDISFNTYLRSTGEVLAGALSHQDYPFDRLVHDLGHGPDVSLFDVFLAVQPIEGLPVLTGLDLSPLPPEPVGPKALISVTFVETADSSLDLWFDFDPARMTPVRANQIVAALLRMIDAVTEDPDGPLGAIYLLDPIARTALANAKQQAPLAETLIQRFTSQVAKTPDATALTAADGTVDYETLNRRSNGLAHYLRTHFGTGRGDRVALALTPSTDLIVAMLAILKTGAAYVPIDPEGPKDRNANLITTAHCSALFYDTIAPEELWGHADIALDLASLEIASEENSPADGPRPDDLSYIVFTSGSTGQPKGVMVEHHSVCALVDGLVKPVFNSDTPHSVALMAPVIFDASVQQIFSALLGGHRLVLTSPNLRREGPALIEHLIREKVTLSDATPSLLTLLLAHGLGQAKGLALRHIIVGGEALSTSLARQVLAMPSAPELLLTNVYGPTECTVDCAAWNVLAPELPRKGTTPIGTALGAAQIIILDPTQRPVPTGTLGEIAIGGPGVARGYLDPDLTNVRFVSHPQFGRIFLSGDIGWVDPDGKIHFVGRRDGQVKLRGHRIELGEVDHVLERNEAVVQAITIIHGVDENAWLVSYVIMANETDPDTILAECSNDFPDYMRPGRLIPLKKMPLTPSGKIDRRALQMRPIDTATTGRAPETDDELRLVGIWSEVLGVTKATMDSHFISNGGHSLAAARLLTKVEDSFGVVVSLKKFYAQPTLNALLDLIKNSAPSARLAITPEPLPDPKAAPLSSAQFRLWAMDQMNKGSAGYAMPAAWKIEGPLDSYALHAALKTVVQRHESLHMRFVRSQGAPVQLINPELVPDFLFSDLSKDGGEAAAMVCAAKEIARPFDLAKGPMVRAALWQVGLGQHVFFLNLHHIIADGHSLDLLGEELWVAYAAHQSGTEPLFDGASVPYRRFVADAAARANGTEAKIAQDYWVDTLTPLPLPLDLPTDHPRPARRVQTGATLTVMASQDAIQTLSAKSCELKTTPFALLGAATVHMLGRLTGQSDLIIGVPVSGRPTEASQKVVGLCAETLPLRLSIAGSIPDLAHQVQDSLARALDHQSCTLDQILKAVKPPRVLDRSPLFDVLMSYHEGSDIKTSKAGLQISPLALPIQGSQFDLAFYFNKEGEALSLSVQYDDALFDADRIRALAQNILVGLDLDESLTVSAVKLAQTSKNTKTLTPQSPPTNVVDSSATRKMLTIWQKVMDQPNLGADDDFFLFGGHSLTAADLARSIYQEFGCDLLLSEVLDHSTARELAAHVERTSQEPQPITHITRLPAQDDYQVSPAQLRLWLIDQIDSQQETNHLPACALLTGPVDLGQLSNAIDSLVARHAALRTRILPDLGDGNGPRQRSDCTDITLQRFATADVTSARAALAPLLTLPFNLENGPLFRIGIAPTGDGTHLLAFCLHHIIADGWSIGVLMHDLASLYCGKSLAPLRVEYHDCAEHQAKASPDDGLLYWTQRLAGPPPRLDLPSDQSRPPRQNAAGAMHSVTLDKVVTSNLRAYAIGANVSLFTVLTALFKAFLYRITGETDITLGTPVAGRDHPDYADQIGLFLNLLTLRNTVTPEGSFDDLVQTVAQSVVEAIDHGAVPFDQVVEAIGAERDLSRSPLFDAMIIMQELGSAALNLGDVTLFPETINAPVAKTDLSLICEPIDAELRLHFEYATALFSEQSAHNLATQFVTLLSAALATPDSSIANLPLLDQQQSNALLVQGNLTDVSTAAPDHMSAVAAFLAWAEKTPSQTAVIAQDGKLTYAQLYELSARIAGALQAKGIASGDRVAVELRRSARLPAALMGILRAGAVFVPIDPDLPEQRKAIIRDDSGCSASLSDEGGDINFATLNTAALPAKLPECQPDQLAYLLFTSGSTGRPKAVEISHAALAAFVTALPERFGLGQDDVVAGLTSISFDISILELIGALTAGATLALCDETTLREPRHTVEWMNTTGVTFLQTTPTRLKMLMENAAVSKTDVFAETSDLRTVLVGGEALPTALRHRLGAMAHIKAHEVYGPTETTIWSSSKRLTPNCMADLGTPLPGEAFCVLSLEGTLQPVNVAGELVIFGAGLAKGYRSDPIKTNAAFFDLPAPISMRGYRTGDKARWRPDGRLEFLGRLDSQVKLRGYRIELGEIEAALAAAPGVVQCAAILMGKQETTRLVAHVAGATCDRAKIHATLRDRLPAYALPNLYEIHDSLPLLASGKIDRNALKNHRPNVTISELSEASPALDLFAAQVAQIWKDVLEKPDLNPEANFFDLGGQSLMAAQVVRRVRDNLHRQIDLGDLFAQPTLDGFINVVRDRGRPDQPPLVPAKHAADYPLSQSQRRIWAAQQLAPESTAYLIHGAFRLDQPLDAKALEAAFNMLSQRHAALRTRFISTTDGPRQIVAPQPAVKLLCSLIEDGDIKTRNALVLDDSKTPMSLEIAPLIRARLIQEGQTGSTVSLTLHHAIADGRSLEILMADLESAYVAVLNGQPQADPTSISQADFAVWEEGLLQQDAFLSDAEFWQNTLSDTPSPIDLPGAFAGRIQANTKGATYTHHIAENQADGLRVLAAKQTTTLFPVLTAGLAILLHRMTGREKFLLGTITENRTFTNLDPVIGCFVNIVPILCETAPESTGADLINAMSNRTMLALAHAQIPFDDIVRQASGTRHKERAPLFDLAITFNDVHHIWRDTFSGVALKDVTPSARDAKYDLLLTISPLQDGGLKLVFDYRTGVYTEEVIAQAADLYTHVLAALITNPNLPLIDFDLGAENTVALEAGDFLSTLNF